MLLACVLLLALGWLGLCRAGQVTGFFLAWVLDISRCTGMVLEEEDKTKKGKEGFALHFFIYRV